MYRPADVLDAARIIRPLLKQLLGAEADEVARSIDGLLLQSDEALNVDRQILELLAQREPTRRWTHFFLTGDGDRQPATVRGYAAPPGTITAVTAQLYACPNPGCPFGWRCRAAGQSVPSCPVHNVVLRLVTPAN
jgi:hypothetical protein